MKKRIFVESDILHSDKLDCVKRHLELLLESEQQDFLPEIFDVVIEGAMHKPEELIKAVVDADEIYINSSLIGLTGGYFGAPMLFDAACQKAVELGITGKKIVFLRPFADIWWSNIDAEMLRMAFANNELYVTAPDDMYKLVRVDTQSADFE